MTQSDLWKWMETCQHKSTGCDGNRKQLNVFVWPCWSVSFFISVSCIHNRLGGEYSNHMQMHLLAPEWSQMEQTVALAKGERRLDDKKFHLKLAFLELPCNKVWVWKCESIAVVVVLFPKFFLMWHLTVQAGRKPWRPKIVCSGHSQTWTDRKQASLTRGDQVGQSRKVTRLAWAKMKIPERRLWNERKEVMACDTIQAKYRRGRERRREGHHVSSVSCVLIMQITCWWCCW